MTLLESSHLPFFSFVDFPVKVYLKNEKPKKSSLESGKTSSETERTQSSSGAPSGGLPSGLKHLPPTLVKDNLSYGERERERW